MSYKALLALEALSDDMLASRIRSIDELAANKGFERLHAQERFSLVYGICRMPNLIDNLTHCSPGTKRALRKLLLVDGQRSFTRTAVILLTELLDRDVLHELCDEPLPGGPAVVIIANIGAQVPVSEPTLGNLHRNRRGEQPPLGSYLTATLLNWLGVETHVFNLALGEPERQELRETMKRLGERLWLVSFASNFLRGNELEAVYRLHNILKNLKVSPRLIGGGMGVSSSPNVYLRYTPIDVIVDRYGGLSLGDMIFSSDYQGPKDNRSNMTLFSHLPNLIIAVRSPQGFCVYHTRKQPYSPVERQVLGQRFDPRRIPIRKKYWAPGYASTLCAPDDLNIPVGLETLKESTYKNSYLPIHGANSGLHPANYVYRPHSIQLLTTYGNCPRGCKFCQYTNYDKNLDFLDAETVVRKLNQVVSVYPEVQMFALHDDDFLLRKELCWDLIRHLKDNQPTQQKVFYIETAPIDVSPTLMRALYEVGFRAILLGFESPIERIVRHTGKLNGNHSFKEYLRAPRLIHQLGFYTRMTIILFYPIVTEYELAQTLKELIAFIESGIAVSVFPYVKALPGTAFASSTDHDFDWDICEIPKDSGKIVKLPRHVLPDDPLVRGLAQKSLEETMRQLDALIKAHRIEGDYPMPLGVLALFRSIVKAWATLQNRRIPDDILQDLRERIDQAVESMVRRHFVQLKVLQAIYRRTRKDWSDYRELKSYLDDEASRLPVLDTLRMFLDFGDKDEIQAAVTLSEQLMKGDIQDQRFSYSLQYRTNEVSRRN